MVLVEGAVLAAWNKIRVVVFFSLTITRSPLGFYNLHHVEVEANAMFQPAVSDTLTYPQPNIVCAARINVGKKLRRRRGISWCRHLSGTPISLFDFLPSLFHSPSSTRRALRQMTPVLFD